LFASASETLAERSSISELVDSGSVIAKKQNIEKSIKNSSFDYD
jgi:hypothetical protein